MNDRDQVKVNISKRLKACADSRQMSQKEMAAATGISESMVFAILGKRRCPSAEIIYKAAKGLRVSADYLLGLD